MQLINPAIRNILLIDDDEDDFSVFQEALKDISPNFKLSYANTCQNVLAELEHCKPDLLFLDINLPRVTGLACLKEIKESVRFCKIPIVMYSNSQFPKDITESYTLGATLYFHKTSSYTELVSSLRDILQMTWYEPEHITAKYYADGTYSSYVNPGKLL